MRAEHWKNRSLKNIKGETWRDVVGYEGYYMVSNFGRIKSLARIVTKRHKSGQMVKMPYKEFIMAICKYSIGYIGVGLMKNAVYGTYFVHRIVAVAFLENPHNKPQVNHRFGIRHDNRVSQLEWVTHAENQKHSFDVLGREPTRNFGLISARRIRVARVNNYTGSRVVYSSQTEAAKKNNLAGGTICNRLKKTFKRPSKYKWEYA